MWPYYLFISLSVCICRLKSFRAVIFAGFDAFLSPNSLEMSQYILYFPLVFWINIDTQSLSLNVDNILACGFCYRRDLTFSKNGVNIKAVADMIDSCQAFDVPSGFFHLFGD